MSKILCLGMTKAEVRELLGPPDDWSRGTRKYKEPAIWKYEGKDGHLELTFWIRPGRVPYPGSVLLRVKAVSADLNNFNWVL